MHSGIESFTKFDRISFAKIKIKICKDSQGINMIWSFHSESVFYQTLKLGGVESRQI